MILDEQFTHLVAAAFGSLRTYISGDAQLTPHQAELAFNVIAQFTEHDGGK